MPLREELSHVILHCIPALPLQAYNEARHLSNAADAFAADLLVEAVAWAKPDGPGAAGLGLGRAKQHLRTDHLDFKVRIHGLSKVSISNFFKT